MTIMMVMATANDGHERSDGGFHDDDGVNGGGDNGDGGDGGDGSCEWWC